MANYKYVGCVTGFSEGGSVQTIAPTEPLYSVTRPANAYTERLEGVGLLVGDELGSSDQDDGDNSLANFIKLETINNQLFHNLTPGEKVGLSISMNGGPIVPWFSVVPAEASSSPTSAEAILEPLDPHPEYDVYGSFVGFDARGSTGYPDMLPGGERFDYLFGHYFTPGAPPPPPDSIVGLVTLTLYPASAHASDLTIEYDLFDFIIDPDHYTAEEIAWFADSGVEPATKNADGSYTLKSQLTLPPLPPPEQPPL